MDVAIIGCGAMGSLFGGYLADAGVPVRLIDTDRAHVDAMNEDGLVIETPEGPRRVAVEATTDPAAVGPVELLVVFTKSHDTSHAIDDATPLLDDTDVLTLQNGLGNPETIASVVDEERVIAGATAHGSTELGPGRVRHAGRGPTTLGRYFVENDRRVDAVAELLGEAGIETAVTSAITEAVWEKVLVNVGINAATALARIRNGRLVQTDPGRHLLRRAVEEAAAVAAAEGVPIRRDPVEHTTAVAERTGENRSSMRQDLEAGRRTEIDALNAEIVRRGRDHGIETPVNRTLTDLVRVAERGPEDSVR